jgi:hypothetical protein
LIAATGRASDDIPNIGKRNKMANPTPTPPTNPSTATSSTLPPQQSAGSQASAAAQSSAAARSAAVSPRTAAAPVKPVAPTSKTPRVEDADLQAVNNLKMAHATIKQELKKVIVGQEQVIDELLISIFTRSHALLVGVPGLAKTLLISSLAQTLHSRRRAGPGENAARANAGAVSIARIQSRAVHARSDAQRYHRH